MLPTIHNNLHNISATHKKVISWYGTLWTPLFWTPQNRWPMAKLHNLTGELCDISCLSENGGRTNFPSFHNRYTVKVFNQSPEFCFFSKVSILHNFNDTKLTTLLWEHSKKKILILTQFWRPQLSWLKIKTTVSSLGYQRDLPKGSLTLETVLSVRGNRKS